MPIEGAISYVAKVTGCLNPGDVVGFEGHAKRTPPSDGRDSDPDGPDEDDSPPEDVTNEIVIRGQGPVPFDYTIVESDVQNYTFAAYVGSVRFAKIDLPVKYGCKALRDATEDERKLAALLFVEGNTDGGGDAERRAQAAVIVNRARAIRNGDGNKQWSSTVAGACEDPGQTAATDRRTAKAYQRYSNVDAVRCMAAKECQLLTHLLQIAKDAIADPAGGDPIFQDTGEYAYYFNGARNSPPDGPQSPILRQKGIDHWSHSFYGSTKYPSPTRCLRRIDMCRRSASALGCW